MRATSELELEPRAIPLDRPGLRSICAVKSRQILHSILSSKISFPCAGFPEVSLNLRNGSQVAAVGKSLGVFGSIGATVITVTGCTADTFDTGF